MTFDTAAGEEVYMKMGVSFKSVDQARQWLEDEIPA
ncbi:MAG: glycoside hydrolase family 92 protein [Clostridiales bacterium]|nr:glycoside hydrolase family 92 protein [Clostridiales bacterium]